MKMIGILKSQTGLLSREYPDQRSGETRRVNWVEVYVSDGVDEFVGELVVRPTQQPDGTMAVVPPQLETGGLYVVEYQLSTNVSKAGTAEERRFNKLTVTRMGLLRNVETF